MASTTVGHRFLEPDRGALGVRHALLVFAAPRALFNRVEDTGAYGWALLTLLGLTVLLGYAQAQTGLIDETVDKQTETQLANIEQQQGQLVDRVQLKDRMEAVRKEAVFNKTIARLGVILVQPIYLLASFMLTAAALYALVALTGRKPEYHTLMSLCVYAGFIELLAYALRFSMMVHYRTTDVDTSLRLLGTPRLAPFLGAIDPFRIWFWVLVGIGLTVTQQLSRRMAVVACSGLCLAGIGVHIALGFAQGSGGGN